MRPSLTRAAVAAASVLVVAASAAHAASLTHSYSFDGSYADALGGPSLAPNGGTLAGGSYHFAANQGLTFNGTLPAAYSIELYFEFDAVSGYRKIVDFKNRGSDTGLYNLSGTLYFYNVAPGSNEVVQANTLAHVVLTRDDAGLTTGYVNGVQQFAFADNSGLAVPSASVLHFLLDDNANGGEASAGSVDFIRIYDGALSATEVAALSTVDLPAGPVVPTPAAASAGLALLSALSLTRRRHAST